VFVDRLSQAQLNLSSYSKWNARTFCLTQLRLSIMPLEVTMMIIDNSEYMRNGDYQPNRFEAQSDAVATIFRTKIDSNPENTAGIMTMAGKGYVRAFLIPVIMAHKYGS
jgi:hypothetical protein